MVYQMKTCNLNPFSWQTFNILAIICIKLMFYTFNDMMSKVIHRTVNYKDMMMEDTRKKNTPHLRVK